MKYKFSCGCEFEQHSETLKTEDGLPSISIDFNNLRDCKRTWELLGTGKTKGIFQLENKLGSEWSEKIEPWNIEDLAALISLIRPGVLKSMLEGKSLAQHYVDRRHKREDVSYIHDSLKKVLEDTYGILCYQEQAMRIAQEIAGFDEKESDNLRKSIGKKDSELMSKIKIQFLEGCEKTNVVTKEIAEEIFGWIQESQKYSFNKSHGVGYGSLSYYTAYLKAHFPLQFFLASLYYAKYKQDERYEIQHFYSDMKSFDIKLETPSLSTLRSGNAGEFGIKDNKIHFGVSNVKGIGYSRTKKFIETIEELEAKQGKTIDKFTWLELLILVLSKTTKTIVNNLIDVGFFKFKSRKELLFEYNIWAKLNDRECLLIENNIDKCKTLRECLVLLLDTPKKEGGLSTKNRVALIKDLINIIDNPTYKFNDVPEHIAKKEKDLLGVSISATSLDSCVNHEGNMTAKEFLDGKGGNPIIRLEIIGRNEYNIKNGKNRGKKMGALQAEDSTGRIDSILSFAEDWEENKHKCYVGATVLIIGERSSNNALIAKKVVNI